MDPQMILAPLIPISAIVAFAAVRIARIRAGRPESLSADVTARVDQLERDYHDLHEQLAETQERLDFAERLLTKARDDRQIGS
jgi:hypothetical protein